MGQDKNEQSMDELINEWALDVRDRWADDFHLMKASIAQIASVRRAKVAAIAARAINEEFYPTEHLRIKKEF